MPNIFFESLGCDKNLVDSEKMLGLLSDAGYSFTDREEDADVIVVNTCAFIGDAKEESIQEILRLAAYKENGRCRSLIAAGCLAERYKEEILSELPELDAVVGTSSWDRIVSAVEKTLHKRDDKITLTRAEFYEDISRLPASEGPRILTTGGHYAYLKIAEGCDKYCTYCAIPYCRGRYRSVPMEDLVREAEQLAAKGVKELILVAQETTLYGTDLYGEKKLPELIRRLGKVQGICWIRLLYGYPEELTDEMIDLFAEEPKLCHYLDLPIQHASDRILRAMGRKTTREEVTALIRRLREKVPDIALRTTLMSGFPGETEEDHAENLSFVSEIRFERLGVFAYSREEGTAAASFKDQVPKRLREKRRNELMRLQQKIAFEKAKEMPGRQLDVMVEGSVADEEHVYVSRTYADAPDVDGLLFFTSGKEYLTGDLVRVLVTGAKGYDLIGEVVEDQSAE